MNTITAGALAMGLYLGFGFFLLWRLFSAYGVRAPKSTSPIEGYMWGVRTAAAVVVWPIVSLIFLPNLWKSLQGKRYTE